MIVKINVKPVTPVYTGDAFSINTIKPQSIMGSLRFWFEVFLKAVGYLPSDYNYNTENFDIEEYKENVKKCNSLYEARIKSFEKINLPSRIFGCTGLKSKIAIKNINYSDKKANNCLNLKSVLSMEIRGRISKWYFPLDYFYKSFTIEFFIVEKNILTDILFPLLNFIEKYGYLGGKNNLGFGRVEFVFADKDYGSIKDYEVFKLAKYGDGLENIEISKAVKTYNTVEDMYYISKIGLCIKDTKRYGNEYYYEIIKELIEDKANLRREFKKKFGQNKISLRHYIFGISGKDANATKIIPWIYKVGFDKYEYGFISLTFLDKDMVKKGCVSSE